METGLCGEDEILSSSEGMRRDLAYWACGPAVGTVQLERNIALAVLGRLHPPFLRPVTWLFNAEVSAPVS